MTRQLGGPGQALSGAAVEAFVHEALAGAAVDRRRVCVLVPDATRTCPLPLLVGALHRALHGRVADLTILVALGTHAPLDDAQLATLVGAPPGGLASHLPGTTVRNHEWADPATLVSVGAISATRVAELSEGRLRRGVDVRINRAVLEHDLTLIVGPVFPHEVVGFSGGNKYLFPGVSGPEMIDLSHWLGALITSSAIIGRRGTTPVRALIDEAAALVPGERLALCVVTDPDASSGLCTLAFGDPVEAWAAAAAVSAEAHVKLLDAPVRRVLSLVPSRYTDLWTGAKGFYKVEPVVADGGQVVLHAPHIREVSAMHPGLVELGYHCRDYFLANWAEFSSRPWGELAHSTHLRGVGTFDPVHGERSRVTVTLATSIPPEVVHKIGLDHLDPDAVDVEAWAADPGTLVVPDAGEDLYRLR